MYKLRVTGSVWNVVADQCGPAKLALDAAIIILFAMAASSLHGNTRQCCMAVLNEPNELYQCQCFSV